MPSGVEWTSEASNPAVSTTQSNSLGNCYDVEIRE